MYMTSWFYKFDLIQGEVNCFMTAFVIFTDPNSHIYIVTGGL